MEQYFADLSIAVSVIASPKTLAIMFLGIVLGTMLGSLPGFGASQSLALLLPVTFAMSAEHAILFLLAIYSAAEYGGSIPAILIRTPGMPANAVTILDGYPMAQRGLANRALRISIYSGVIGGIVSTLIALVAGSSLAWIGLQFGPGEMFAIGVFGLTIVSSFFGRDPAKGFVATCVGLLLATIGTSGFGGMRFTWDQPYLMSGIPLIVVVIGVLAVPEAMRLLTEPSAPGVAEDPTDTATEKVKDQLRWVDIKRLVPTWMRASLIGTGVGVVPGAGPEIASIISYNEERRWSKRGERFGTGVEEGLAAPETANNAVVAGTLVPSLALGVPGSGAAAILLGVIISKGVAPGPLLFSDNGDFVLTVFLGLIAGNLILLMVGVASARVWAQVARVPLEIVGPLVCVLILIGTYSFNGSPAHIVMVILLGLLAYHFNKIGIPSIPIVLAFVMGPIIEQNLNRALTISRGNLSDAILHPLTVTILLMSALTAIYGYLSSSRSRS